VSVGMGVDETRVEQPAARRDLDRLRRSRTPGGADFADRVILDQNICRFKSSSRDVEHAAAAQDREGHGIVSSKRPR